tara:strand:+ start:2252 stop:3763 length:1512 start_codon:yes stop_codon:yes gene_type:complete
LEFDLTFQHQLLNSHLAKLTNDDLTVIGAGQRTGDVDVLLKWYWNRDLLPALKPVYYASHPNIFVLGSWGSGKTVNLAAIAFLECLTKSYFRFVNVAPVGRQALVMFKFLRDMIRDNDRIEHLITKTVARPYPIIRFWNGSTAEFLTAKPEYLDYLQGEEFDQVNIDEAALLDNFERTVGVVRSRLRGKRHRIGVPRSRKLTVTTVPGYDEILRDRYERGLKENPDFLSIKITAQHNPHLDPEDIRLMLIDVPDEDIPIYMDCEWPEIMGRLIQAAHYDACEDITLNIEMDKMIQEKKMGSAYTEPERMGCTYWEWPVDDTHTYVTVGDPGTGNPPRRNAGVVMVWDVSNDPATLVYFDWIAGNGSIMPWVTSFKYAKDKYPGPSGFDSTAAQKWMDELVFETEGIIVTPLNFRRDKMGFLNALRIVLERRTVRFPFIQGMKRQARAYNIPDDKMAQDTTAALMMSAWMIRPAMGGREPEQGDLPRARLPRGTRSGRRGTRTR